MTGLCSEETSLKTRRDSEGCASRSVVETSIKGMIKRERGGHCQEKGMSSPNAE